jgi:hypothetical protein
MWEDVKLRDGHLLPSIGFGTWGIGAQLAALPEREFEPGPQDLGKPSCIKSSRLSL